MTNWPAWYPIECPPASSIPAVGEFYRLVKHDPPVEVDFETYLEQLIAQHPKRNSSANDVEDAAISLLQAYDDAKYTWEFIPGMKKRKIALGEIVGAGLMQAKPEANQPTHFNWWMPLGDLAWKNFSVVP